MKLTFGVGGGIEASAGETNRLLVSGQNAGGVDLLAGGYITSDESSPRGIVTTTNFGQNSKLMQMHNYFCKKTFIHDNSSGTPGFTQTIIDGQKVFSIGYANVLTGNPITSGRQVAVGVAEEPVDYDLRIAGNCIPEESSGGDTRDLGTASLKWRNLYVTTVYPSVVEPSVRISVDDGESNGRRLEFGTHADVKYYFKASDHDHYIEMEHACGSIKWLDGSPQTHVVRMELHRSSGDLDLTGSVTENSDERLKENIQTLDPLKIFDMRGVSYIKDNREDSGVIAQEVEQVAPEVVTTKDDEQGFKSVRYSNLTGYLIEGVKHLKKENEELKNQINEIKQILKDLQNGNS